jgi:hypothetical protein
MKHLKSTESKKFILFLIGMLLVMIALPMAIKLVQQNQENRSSAAETQCKSGDIKCEGGYKYLCSSYKWEKTTTKCEKIVVTPTKAAKCKSGERRCATLKDVVCVTAPCSNEIVQVCSSGAWKNESPACTYGCSNGYCKKEPIESDVYKSIKKKFLVFVDSLNSSEYDLYQKYFCFICTNKDKYSPIDSLPSTFCDDFCSERFWIN